MSLYNHVIHHAPHPTPSDLGKKALKPSDKCYVNCWCPTCKQFVSLPHICSPQ